jgi:hypothetical protein
MEEFLIPALIALYLAKIPNIWLSRSHPVPLVRWVIFILRLVIVFVLSLIVAYCYKLVI